MKQGSWIIRLPIIKLSDFNIELNEIIYHFQEFSIEKIL